MFTLGIKNFRGFLDNEFTFSRVNILIGENSAGKSSLLKFLLVLKQSLLPPNSRDYNLTLAGEEVDLGNYEEVIYNHEVDRNLSFSFEVGKEFMSFFLENFLRTTEIQEELKLNLLKVMDSSKDSNINKFTLTVELNKELSNKNKLKIIINEPSIGSISIIPNIITTNGHTLTGNTNTCDILYNDISIKDVEYELLGFIPMIPLSKIREQLPVKEIYQLLLISWLTFYCFTQLISIKYSNNPDFEAAKRMYFKRDKKMNGSIKNIEELIYLLSGEGLLQGVELQEFIKTYTERLQLFGIIDNLYVKKSDSVRELRVIVNGIDSNITDVGFGVSLQLPIIAQAMLTEAIILNSKNGILKKGGTILIEQPEIHLHPSLQAKFIESLLQAGENNSYFIETHSEHIVRKLQVLVKEGKYGLKPEDVCIHYFRKENGHIVNTLHRIDGETGKLSPKFPSGFYDVSTNLAFELIS